MFNKVYEQIPEKDCYENKARAAINFWMVKKATCQNIYDGKVKAIIDLRGGIYSIDNPEAYWNIWEEYTKGKSIAAIVSKLDRIIMTD